MFSFGCLDRGVTSGIRAILGCRARTVSQDDPRSPRMAYPWKPKYSLKKKQYPCYGNLISLKVRWPTIGSPPTASMKMDSQGALYDNCPFGHSRASIIHESWVHIAWYWKLWGHCPNWRKWQVLGDATLEHYRHWKPYARHRPTCGTESIEVLVPDVWMALGFHPHEVLLSIRS
jgi:hypothetical protein